MANDTLCFLRLRSEAVLAKIVPLGGDEMNPDEVSLVASGQMMLPKQELDHKRFWAMGSPMRSPRPIIRRTFNRCCSADERVGSVCCFDRGIARLMAHVRSSLV